MLTTAKTLLLTLAAVGVIATLVLFTEYGRPVLGASVLGGAISSLAFAAVLAALERLIEQGEVQKALLQQIVPAEDNHTE